MLSQQLTPRLIVAFIGIVLAFVILFLGLMRADNLIRSIAVDGCAAISKYQKNDKGQDAIVTYPIQDVYKDCLQRKGL